MTETLPPAPPLLQYYGDPAKRERFVRDIFDDTAPWYDDILGLLSFGSEGRYRRQALARGGLREGMRLLDLATGTGAVARAASTITGNITGVDASIGMLLAGRAKQRFPLMLARGERLPLRDASFDMITTGYALRHFADLHTLFSECRRVLRPGGRLLILEITPPHSPFGRAMLRLHMDGIVPFLARLRSRNREAARLMHYYWDTIAACVPPESIMEALRRAGFGDVQRHVELGIFSEYTAARSPAATSA